MHSLLSPSSAASWVICPGAPLLRAMHPREATEDTLRGEATHWICEMALTHPHYEGYDLTGTTAPNGTHIDVEMIEAAGVYVRDIQATYQHQANGHPLHVEQLVQIPRIHAECYGTPDAFWYDVVTHTLYVWDFKFGRGIVEAADNWQAICYISGIMDRLGLSDQGLTVCFRVVQPRAYHPLGPVREWRIAATELRGPVNTLHGAAAEVMAAHKQQTLRTGKHCRYCEARHHCSALRGAAYYACDVATLLGMPDDLNGMELGLELRLLEAAQKQLGYRIEGLRADLEHRIKSGDATTGWELKGGTGAKAWTAPVAEVLSVADLCGIDLRKPVELITPTQAEEKGIDSAVISAYSTRKSSALKLVPIDENQAARVFGRSKG